MNDLKEFLMEVLLPAMLCIGLVISVSTMLVLCFQDHGAGAPPTPTQQTIEDNKKISEAQTILLSRCIERLGWCQDICDYEAEAARREK